jgi:hypothetical protein
MDSYQAETMLDGAGADRLEYQYPVLNDMAAGKMRFSFTSKQDGRWACWKIDFWTINDSGTGKVFGGSGLGGSVWG